MICLVVIWFSGAASMQHTIRQCIAESRFHTHKHTANHLEPLTKSIVFDDSFGESYFIFLSFPSCRLTIELRKLAQE